MLMRGVDVDFGSETKHIDIIDENVTGNRFDVVSQFVYREQKVTKKPDVVMLINGVPVVVGELKYGVSNDCDDAITDMQTYEDEVESLFRIPLFNIAITSRKLKYGSINAPLHQYNQWRPEDIVSEYQYDELGYYDKDKSLKSLCDPEKILDILNNFVMFQRDGGGLAKIIPRHQQYFAVKAIFDRFRKSKEKGMSARGLIWHTQGSGKSYTMFYAAVQAVRQCNSQAYILVDRNNLEEQMRKDLSDIGHPVTADVADSKEELRELIQSGSQQIVLTTVQLFEGITEGLQTEEAFVFVDEAHRFMEKDFGNHIDIAFSGLGADGSMNESPPDHHFGFTGTPVNEDDRSRRRRNTFNNYSMPDEFDTESPYLHRYSMEQAIEEGNIVEVNIEDRSKAISWELDEEEIDTTFEAQMSKDEREEAKRKISDFDDRYLAEVDAYVEELTEDIVDYYEENVEANEGAHKAMVITQTRESVAKFAETLQERMGEEAVKGIYSGSADDSGLLKKHQTTASEREKIQEEFKQEDSELQVIVVCDMLLTGFDAPVLGCIFLEKELKEHRLLQAVARANRPNDKKSFGEIVDYGGVAKANIDQMYEDIEESVELGVCEDREELIEEYDDKLDELCSYIDLENGSFDGVDSVFEKMEEIYRNREYNTFMREFKELRDLHISLSPDKRLAENQRSNRYDAVKQAYKVMKKIENDESGVVETEKIIAAAKKAVDEGADVERKDVNGDESSVTDVVPENIGVRTKQKELKTSLEERDIKTPKIKSLSERVREIIKDYDHGATVDEIQGELEEVEEELDSANGEYKSGKELYRQIVFEVIEEEVDGEYSISVDFADTIVETFLQHWKTTESMRPNKRKVKLRNEINRKLLRGNKDSIELAQTSFTNHVVNYLIENVD